MLQINAGKTFRQKQAPKAPDKEDARKLAKFMKRKDELANEIANILAEPAAWLAMPNDQFGGRRPLDLVDTDREHLLWEWLIAVKCGMFS